MAQKKIKNFLGRNLNRIRSDDRLSGEARSNLMSRIRSKNTQFERDFIESLCERTRLKFSVNDKSIRGKPDIVFQRRKICVFLDSDFWHGWQYPRWKHLLKDDFWRDKIEKNRKRDQRNTAYLRRQGWKVVRLWEHNIKFNFQGSIDKVLSELQSTQERR